MKPVQLNTPVEELLLANKELAFQNKQKRKKGGHTHTHELIVANKEVVSQNKEIEKRAAELVIANKELIYQNKEKEKRSAELVIAKKELVYQNKKNEKCAEDLVIAKKELVHQTKEKGKRTAELSMANRELAYQNKEKKKRASELIIANRELLFQNQEKKKRAVELFNTNKELALQNEDKEKRAKELIIAKKELAFQNEEKGKRAKELIIADKQLIVANKELEKTEEELKVTHERLLFHVDNTPLGYIEWDREGHIKYKSAKAEKIFGWTMKELIAGHKTAYDQVYAEDLPQVSKIAKQLINGEIESNRVENRNITKDGQVIWCEWFNSVLKGEDGKVKTIMSLVQDITKRKQVEWQKDNLLSMVSHELKTPVTTIKAYAQIVEEMLEKKGDEDTLVMIKKMGTQVSKLTKLIGTLLDFTKMQQGKLMYNEAFFDFNELMKEVADDMQKIIPTHAIKNNPGSAAIIFGDKDKLSQVINNMISNAVKYSPKADNILVSTRQKKDGIEFSVHDFGIGILPHEQQHVFEQFYRVNADRSTFPGMGIGLFICSEIISRHGGKIWVESIIDKGSTFYIWLPFDHRKSVS